MPRAEPKVPGGGLKQKEAAYHPAPGGPMPRPAQRDDRKVLAMFGAPEKAMKGRVMGALWRSLWSRLSESYTADGDTVGLEWYWGVLTGAISPNTSGEGSEAKIEVLKNEDGAVRVVSGARCAEATYAAACWVLGSRGVPNKKFGKPETPGEATAREWFGYLQVERRLINDIYCRSERFSIHSNEAKEEKTSNLKRAHLGLFIGTARVAKTEAEYQQARARDGESVVSGSTAVRAQSSHDPLEQIAEKAAPEREAWARSSWKSAARAGEDAVIRVMPELLHLAGMLRAGDSGQETAATYGYGVATPARRAPAVEGWPTVAFPSSSKNILIVYSVLAGEAMSEGDGWQENTRQALDEWMITLDEEKSTEKSVHVYLPAGAKEAKDLPGGRNAPFPRVLFALLSALGGKKALGLVTTDSESSGKAAAQDVPLGLFGVRRVSTAKVKESEEPADANPETVAQAREEEQSEPSAPAVEAQDQDSEKEDPKPVPEVKSQPKKKSSSPPSPEALSRNDEEEGDEEGTTY